MSKKDLCKILIKQNENLYVISEITYSSDGTAIIVFPYIPEAKGIVQSLALLRKKLSSKEVKPRILNDSQFEKNQNEKFRISYHTTGRVNYHGSSFSPLFLEPLCNITKQNLFLILSFQQLHKFQSISSLNNERNPFVVIDISELSGMRIDICFSIVPAAFTIKPQNCTSFLIAHAHVYQILVELLTDENTFNFGEIYAPTDCVKIKPHNNEVPQNLLSKSDAVLHYKHILFRTENIIMLPPNSEGEIEIIFPTVMRMPPWIKIDFLNPEHKVQCVRREDWRIFFKVYDQMHSRFVKDAREIIITGLSLDARIYDDNETPPPGYI